MPKENPLSPENQEKEFKKESDAIKKTDKKIIKGTRKGLGIDKKKRE